MLIQIHCARVGKPRADDFVVPDLDALQNDLHVLVRAYHSLVRRVSSRPERMVITHGEPNANNLIVTNDGLVLVDWETTLLAPPERDLWDLAGHDRSLLNRYAAATG